MQLYAFKKKKIIIDLLFDFVVKCDWDRFVRFILIDNEKGEE